MRLYGEKARGIINRTGAQTMLYLTCTMISSVDFAHYRVSRDKDWVSLNSGGARTYCGSTGFGVRVDWSLFSLVCPQDIDVASMDWLVVLGLAAL